MLPTSNTGVVTPGKSSRRDANTDGCSPDARATLFKFHFDSANSLISSALTPSIFTRSVSPRRGNPLPCLVVSISVPHFTSHTSSAELASSTILQKHSSITCILIPTRFASSPKNAVSNSMHESLNCANVYSTPRSSLKSATSRSTSRQRAQNHSPLGTSVIFGVKQYMCDLFTITERGITTARHPSVSRLSRLSSSARGPPPRVPRL